MSDDLETLRQAVEAFGRRKNDLSPAGINALHCVTFNLKVYERARDAIVETRDVRPVDALRKIIMEDIATIEAELRGATAKEEGAE